eukprot:11539991-Alexandrium_andersonii.AAC.1
MPNLRLRLWQLCINGDIQHMAALAINRTGKTAVRATGIEAHAEGAQYSAVWAPRQPALRNAAADQAAGAAAGHLGE